MSESESKPLDATQLSLNRNRSLFNIIVYVVLPASLLLAFVYSILLTRNNKADYLLFIVFVTISYTLVVSLVQLLQKDEDIMGLKYIMNKLELSNNVDANMSVIINNEENICELNFTYPDKKNPQKNLGDVYPQTSKIINGENITENTKNTIKSEGDKKFYERCNSLTRGDNLNEVGQCIGNTGPSTADCSGKIKDLKDATSEEARAKCTAPAFLNDIEPYFSITLAVIAVVFATGTEIYSYVTGGPNGAVYIVAIYLIINLFMYLGKPPCDYISSDYSDITVSPLSKEVIVALFFMTLVKTISYSFFIGMGYSKDFSKLIICLVILSALYIINDYSFISIIEDNYSGLGKFINIMKLDRKTDKINYDISLTERDTSKRCLIDGIWDKSNRAANINGELNDCNTEKLGKYLGGN